MTRKLIGLALIATLIAVYFAPDREDTTVVAPTRTTKAAVSSAVAVAVADGGSNVGGGNVAVTRLGVTAPPGRYDLQIRPRNGEEDMGDLFSGQNMNPAPLKPVAMAAKKVKPGPPPAPEAPPLPFHFLGRLVEDGKVAYFLQLNERNLVMRVGDTVDQTYTLEGINHGTLSFMYLPLHLKQSLDVGEVN
jgi:hypothetical protein